MNTDYTFYRQLVLAIGSNIELSKSLEATFTFLKKEFPIQGITLHRFIPESGMMQLDFLVSNKGYYQLDVLVPLSGENVEAMVAHERETLISHVTDYRDNSVSKQHHNAIADYLSDGPVEYLVAILLMGEQVVGHLCLIGNGREGFTAEHHNKLQLARVPVSLAMTNMLRHRQTEVLREQLAMRHAQLEGRVELLENTQIIGAESGLRRTMSMVEQLAGKETPVLILGETGTGKELIADAVQKASPRRDRPYIKVNCGAIPESLLDSELFGHEKGAFTGAVSSRPGKFEQADGGTLFLDEVGELSLQAQVRLLRVLQNGVVDRVGGRRPIAVNVRIIAATNRPLEQMIGEKLFREDLYYRLNVFPIELPPLRERTEDIPLLVSRFATEIAGRMGLEPQLDFQSLEKLADYPWPGNVRELKNIVARGLTFDGGGVVDLSRYLPRKKAVPPLPQSEDLTELVRREVAAALAERGEGVEKGDAEVAVEMPLDAVIAAHIERVLEHCRGKISGAGGAAELLGVNPNTLRKRMEKLGIAFGRRG